MNYRVAFRLRQVRDVFDIQVKWLRRRNYLDGLAVSEVKGSAQSLVTPNNLAERFFQRDCVESSLQQDGAHEVVSRIAWFELIEKPESLLREGQRSRPGLFTTRDPFETGRSDPDERDTRFDRSR